MCICVNCHWVDRCKAYHTVEKQHGVEHLNLSPDFDPNEPIIHVLLLEEEKGLSKEEDGTTIEDGVIRYKNIQFYSRYDRPKELNLFLESVKHDGELTLYGIADGALPETFLEDETLLRLRIVLLNLSLFFLLSSVSRKNE